MSIVKYAKNQVSNFVEESKLKFKKIDTIRYRKNIPKKAQYKCEKWMTTELYLKFYDNCDLIVVEPEPAVNYQNSPNGKSKDKSFDIFIEDRYNNSLLIEAKERFNGGGNGNYFPELCETVNVFVLQNSYDKLLFFSTHTKPLTKFLPIPPTQNSTLTSQFVDRFNAENKNDMTMKQLINNTYDVYLNNLKVDTIEIDVQEEVHNISHNSYSKTLYLHFYTFQKLTKQNTQNTKQLTTQNTQKLTNQNTQNTKQSNIETFAFSEIVIE